ncbi:MAG: hypothetical protein J1F35_03985 [Erysipelotrichales bacterium]|nr:hypothetical protein [Erysipelotrichales bacterium]
MDFDALVNIKNILVSRSTAKTDLMLFSSAISNNSVDINLSIQDNLDIIRMHSIDNKEFMAYLSEFLDLNHEFLTTPIYKMLLGKIEYFELLLHALKNGNLNEQTITSVINSVFSLLSTLNVEDYSISLVFLNDILSSKSVSYINEANKPDSITQFVINNFDCLEKKDNQYEEAIIIKNIIIKMLKLGVITFADLIYYSDSSSDFVNSLIMTFVNSDEYYYLYAIMNEKTVDEETKPIISSIISEISADFRVIPEKKEILDLVIAKLSKEPSVRM